MVVINIMLALVGLILLLGVIGEKDKERNKNITAAFVAVVALIAILNR